MRSRGISKIILYPWTLLHDILIDILIELGDWKYKSL